MSGGNIRVSYSNRRNWKKWWRFGGSLCNDTFINFEFSFTHALISVLQNRWVIPCKINIIIHINYSTIILYYKLFAEEWRISWRCYTDYLLQTILVYVYISKDFFSGDKNDSSRVRKQFLFHNLFKCRKRFGITNYIGNISVSIMVTMSTCWQCFLNENGIAELIVSQHRYT